MIGDKKIYIISSIFLAIAASLCLFVSIQVISKGYVNIGGYIKLFERAEQNSFN